MAGIRCKRLSTDEILTILEAIPVDNSDDTDIESEEKHEPGNETLNKYLQELLDEDVLPNNLECDILQHCNDLRENEKNVENDNAKISQITPSSSHTNKVAEPNRRWKSKPHKTSIPKFSLLEGPVEGIFDNSRTPTEYFLLFIADMAENVIFQPNLYATQKNKTLNLKKNRVLRLFRHKLSYGLSQTSQLETLLEYK